MGISKKRFEGWEPTTEYVHDRDGRVVSSRPETEWDSGQRGWMLALAEYRASRCSGCGQDVAESTAKEGTHTYRARKRRCWSCDTLATAQASVEQDRPGAVRWWTEKVR